MENDNKLFKNKYHVSTVRYKDWDYAKAGVYFVTICTKDFIPYFGEINKEQIELSNIGRITEKYWQEIPSHFPDVELDEHIICRIIFMR